jgi:hypothetical protein
MKKRIWQTCVLWPLKGKKEIQSLDDEYILSYSELYDAFKSLYYEFKKLGSIYSL